MKRFTLFLFSTLLLFQTTVSAQDKPDFEKDIFPIFELNCLGCHGSTDPQAGLSLATITDLLKGGNNGKSVVPGKSAESSLFLMIAGHKEPKMPPEPLLPLEDNEIAMIKTWIDTGLTAHQPQIEEPPRPKEVAQAKPVDKQVTETESNVHVEVHGNDPFFSMVIQPIFDAKCAKCHSGDNAKAGLIVNDYHSVVQDKFVSAAAPEESLIYTAIMGTSKKAMPPKSQPQLSEIEKDLIRRWIVSLPKNVSTPKPVAPKPAPPEQKKITEVKFDEHIKPIFEAKCAKCHGAEKPKAGLNVLDEHSVEQEKFVIPSKPDQSLIYTAIMGTSQKAMPPKSQPQLTEEEKGLIGKWIAALPPAAKEVSVNETTVSQPEVASKTNQITFESHVLPILNANCAGCHGGAEPNANLRTAEIASILGGKFVVPNKPDESPLYKVIEAGSMPPKPMPPLTKTEAEIIKYWIAKGAVHGGEENKEIAASEQKEITSTLESEYGDTQIGAISFHPAKSILAVGRLYEVQIFEYDASNSLLKLVAVLPEHSHLIRSLQFSPDGKLLAAGGGRPAIEGEIALWNTDDFSLVKKITGHRDNIYGLSFSPDGNTLSSCSYDRTVILWDVNTGEQKSVLEDHVDSVYDVQFSPDGSRLASVAGDRTVKIWNAESGERLYTLSDSGKELYTVTLHPNGNFVAAGGVDRMIRVWQLDENDGVLVQSKFAHDGAILKLTYSPDGGILYSTSDDRRIKAWDTESYQETTTFEEQSDWVYGLDLNYDGSLLAAGRYDGTFDLYDTKNGNKLSTPIQKGVKKVSQIKSFTGNAKVEDSGVSFASTKPASTKKDSVNTNPFEVGALEGTGTYPSFLSSISPRVVTKGDEVEFTLRGKNLADLEVLPDNSKFKIEIIEISEGEVPKYVRSGFDTGRMIVDTGVPYTIKFKMHIPEEINAGNHRIRARTPLAMTNAQSFYVEETKAINEKEGNDTYLDAQQVDVPNIIAGSMNKMNDNDVFAFDAKEGEELTFEVVASAIGSGIDSRLSILDTDGNILCESIDFEDGRDARMGYRFPEDGTYFLQITDSLLRSGVGYRIHVTKRPFITKHYPLGVQKGVESTIQIEGFNLDGKSSVSISVPEDFDDSSYTLPFKSDHGYPIQSIEIAVSDNPVIDEVGSNHSIKNALTVAVPININGNIFSEDHTQQNDYYRFSAKEGEVLIIETAANRFGSALDSKIEILHANGDPVEIATLRSVAETYSVLSDRDSRSRSIRFNSWKDFEINDYVMIGSEILQIERLPDYPDEDVTFIATTSRGWRTGFYGTTPSHHAVDSKIYKVEVHPPHSEFPANGMPVRRLYAQNDDGNTVEHGKDSYIKFEVPKDGDYIVRVSDSLNHNSPDNFYQLSIHPPKPDFKFYVNADRINIPQEGRIPVSVTIDRLDGFDGEVMIDIPNLPEGFNHTLTHIPPGELSSSFLIEALPGAVSTDPNKRYTVDAYAKIDGEWVKRSGSFASITITHEPDIRCDQEPKLVTLVPGGTAKITVKASRHNGFEDRIPIGVRNLPHGVYVLDTGLNGIMITPDELERSYVIYAEPWVKPEALTIFSTLEVETRSALSNSYSTPASVLNITIDPQAIAQSNSEFLQQKKKY